METLGWLNGYQIQYVSLPGVTGWADELPARNWLLFVATGAADQAVIDDLAVECLRRQPLGVCCAGLGAAVVEDRFDELIVLQAVEWEEQGQQPFNYEHAPVTTADADVASGFWFATLNAPNLCVENVESVVCVDVDGTHRAQLLELLHLIKTGWLPDDTI